MIEAVLIALIACAALAFVAAPLRRHEEQAARSTSPEFDEADDARRAALSAIVDLETERDLGKLAPADFETLRRQYEAEAIVALRRLDALQAEELRADTEIEEEIAVARARLACPSCGAPRGEGARCASCGA